MNPRWADSSDEALLSELVENPDALEAFYRRHVNGVTRFLARRSKSPEDVADAVSTTFLAVLVSCRSFDPNLGSPTAWLYSIAANMARRQSKSRDRYAALFERIRGRELLRPDDAERIAEIIDAEREAAVLLPFIASAPESERVVLDRMLSDDLRPVDAARSLGISHAAARNRLTRLRQRVHISAEQACVAAQRLQDQNKEER
jgi:RNA polymerase sigma factor (sigma-70 family)